MARLGIGALGMTAATLVAGAVLGGNIAQAQSVVGAAPVVLAAGQRITLVDNSQPGVMVEIIAPKDQGLPLNAMLEMVGRKGISAALGYARNSANTVVIDASGKLQMKSLSGSIVQQQPSQDRANQITIAGGYITFDRGNIAITAEQVTRPNGVGGAITAINTLKANAANAVPTLTNSISPAIAAPTGISSVSAPTTNLSVANAVPTTLAQVSINGVSLGTVNLNNFTLPANATNVVITSSGNLSIPANFSVPSTVANLTINSPGVVSASGGLSAGNLVINNPITLSPLSTGTLTLNSAGATTTLGGNVALGISSTTPTPLSIQPGNSIIQAGGAIKQVTISVGAPPPPTFINPAGGGISVLNALSNPGTLTITGTLKGK